MTFLASLLTQRMLLGLLILVRGRLVFGIFRGLWDRVHLADFISGQDEMHHWGVLNADGSILEPFAFASGGEVRGAFKNKGGA